MMKKYINTLIVTVLFSVLTLGSMLLDRMMFFYSDSTFQIIFRVLVICFISYFLKDRNVFGKASIGKIIVLLISIIPIFLVIYLQNKYLTDIPILLIVLDILSAISEELVFRYIFVKLFVKNKSLEVKDAIFVGFQYVIYSIIICIFNKTIGVGNILVSIVASFALEILYIKNNSIIENTFLNFLLKFLL